MNLIEKIDKLGKWLEEPAWAGVPRAVFVVPAMLLTITVLIAIIIRL